MKRCVELNVKQSRFLGFYLIFIAMMQSYIYLNMMVHGLSDYFYFDPRIGIFAFLTTLNNEVRPAIDQRAIYFLELSTALWLGFLGIRFVIGKAPLITYIISELLLSAPSLLFVFLIIIINISPAHGFSIGELPLPLISIGLTTFLPLIFILRSVQRGRKQAISGSGK